MNNKKKYARYAVWAAVLVGFHLLVVWWKSRRVPRWSVEDFLEELEALASQAAPQPAPSGEVVENPVGKFTTTYNLGDDYYDLSFSIELPSGEFLGECGVSISETLGTTPPRPVTALEVWLFDKNDIRIRVHS